MLLTRSSLLQKIFDIRELQFQFNEILLKFGYKIELNLHNETDMLDIVDLLIDFLRLLFGV